MKTRTQKMLALLLAGVMTASFVGCGDTEANKGSSAEESKSTATESKSEESNVEEELYYNTEGFPIVKEPITIEMAGLREQTNDWANSHVVKKIEEEMGIKFDITTYETSEILSTQFATQITSDTLPDLMVNYPYINKVMANQYGEEGYLLDFTDYLDIMPNFKKFLEENPEYAAYNTAGDGGIYSFDRVNDGPRNIYQMYVSKADQEKYGFSVDDIKTVDDFYEVLKSIKEQNPDVVPFGWALGYWGARALPVLRTAFGIDGCLNVVNAKGVDEDGNVILHDITENQQAYYKYMNKLWEEELVDHNAFIMTRDEFEADIRAGKYVFWHASGGFGTLKQTDAVVKEYDILVALTSEYNETAEYITYDPYNTMSRTMVSAKTEYPEAICRLLDYQFSDEGYLFFNYGTEGETYDIVENDFGMQVVSNADYWDKDKYGSEYEWRVQEVMINNVFQTLLKQSPEVLNASDELLEKLINEDPNYTYTSAAAMEKAIREQAESTRYSSFLPLAYTDEENSEIAQLETDMGNLLSNYYAQFITGDLDVDADWDAYVEQISIFWDKLQPIMQGAYDRIH